MSAIVRIPDVYNQTTTDCVVGSIPASSLRPTYNDSRPTVYHQTSAASPPIPSNQTTPPPLYALPLNSIDLGKLPLYWNNATPQANPDTNIWYSEQDTKAAEIPLSLNTFAEPGASAFPSVTNTIHEQRDDNLPPALLSGINSGDAGYTGYIQDLRPQSGFVYGQPQSDPHPQEELMEGIVDADTMAMWYNAPSGFK